MSTDNVEAAGGGLRTSSTPSNSALRDAVERWWERSKPTVAHKLSTAARAACTQVLSDSGIDSDDDNDDEAETVLTGGMGGGNREAAVQLSVAEVEFVRVRQTRSMYMSDGLI